MTVVGAVEVIESVSQFIAASGRPGRCGQIEIVQPERSKPANIKRWKKTTTPVTNVSDAAALGVPFHLPVAVFRMSFSSLLISRLISSEFEIPLRSRFNVLERCS